MFTSIRIENFKAWKDTGDIRLAPLTVFFGTNSSGKTSLTQLLLMLKQTAQSPDRKRVLHPGDKSTPVDLGTFHDIVHNHDQDLPVSFRISTQLPETLTVQDPRTERIYRARSMAFEAEVGTNGAGDEQLMVRRMRYELLRNGEIKLAAEMKPTGKTGRYELAAEHYELVRNQGRPWQLPAPVRFYGFPDEATVYYQNAGFLSDLTLALERQLGAIYYLGPLREYPRRAYTWSGETPEHVGWRGDRAIEALLAARERRFNLRPKQKSKSFERMIASWLQEMGLIVSFEARPIAEHRKEYEVLVRTAGSGQPVNLTDVGFGVSQVLPVLVQCLYVPAGSTILLEQPEIHLHPKVQAALADFFIDAIHLREAGIDRNIQLIVESHSEHFLRRLQRRIAEEKIQPEQTALYFCEPTAKGASIRALQVNPYGYITNWPKEFFGDDIGDVAAMTEAALQRRARQQS
ncbi:MAG: DUF3696 domain-containing protein [Deltaproteobacteria bacterium]|nr:DUF3696 domain-containing protein [Deltaproteobacteria bacterium]